MAKGTCIRECYVKGFLYRMGQVYDGIDPKASWAKFFEIPKDAKGEPEAELDAELKAQAARLKAENAALRAAKP
jgi:hypothetical protein